ncbi:MAG: hypothetical protein QM817_28655 [Archangium sp.]
MRQLAVLAVLFVVSCGPMGMAELDLQVIPRSIQDDGREAIVRVTATTAKGEIGKGSVHITSTIGSLKDGVDVTLDQYGTAQTTFTCNKATEAACTGTVTFSAKWVSDKVTVTNEINGSVVITATGSGGGTGGGTGGGGGVFNPSPCPPAPGRIWVYEGMDLVTPVVDEPMNKSLQFACSTAKCEFMEFTGGGRVENLVLISVGSPSGTNFVGDTLFTTGMVGNGMVYRLQYASLMRDCSTQVGNQFKLEQFVIGASSGASHGLLRFSCRPMNSANPQLTGCLNY